jgi:hypothetical protein
LTTGNSELRIVVSQQLGELGPSESKPAAIHWRWYYHLPSLSVWLAAIAALIVSKLSKVRRDWLILIALVLSFVVWQMDGVGILVAVLAIVWIFVWLTGPRRAPSYLD